MFIPKLEIKNLTKTYTNPGRAGIEAVKGVSLFVRQSEIVSLIGPSGCGKSTLLEAVAGLIMPDEGEILLDGKPIKGKKGATGYMPQKDVLFPWRTVLDNVIVALEVRGVSRKAARAEAHSLLPVFGLEKFADSYPHELSGGMRQRASFLRTYLGGSEIMLLDEPFGKLDALTKMQMQQWLLGMWQKFNRTLLLVTHDVDEAILLSDRIYVMTPRPGQIVGEIKVNFARPRDFSITAKPSFAAVKMQVLSLLTDFDYPEVCAGV